MTAPPAPPPPALPADLSNLADRLNAWLGEGRSIEEVIAMEIVRHLAALADLEILQAGTRDAIDHMRELAGPTWEHPRASP